MICKIVAMSEPMRRPFRQVNVFSTDAVAGNPLAVVHTAEGLTEERMAALARWTNLSETTFLLAPKDPRADYRVRIFTPTTELPFAGHPTLGSCHAWLAADGRPRAADVIVQECGAGLVRIRRRDARLEFAAPPLRKTGPLEPDLLGRIIVGLRLSPSDIEGHQWVDNGPGWCAVLLRSASAVLSIDPLWTALGDLNLGVVGPHPRGHEAAFEVRAFIGDGAYEDPVTGSLNASLAQWLIPAGIAPPAYVSSQGTALGRAGLVHLSASGGDVWVGGDVVDVVEGWIDF
jgi:PhzF family phenazine biosynthesis protein